MQAELGSEVAEERAVQREREGKVMKLRHFLESSLCLLLLVRRGFFHGFSFVRMLQNRRWFVDSSIEKVPFFGRKITF